MEELPKTQKEALKRGATRYFTGKPCIYGHIAARFTKSRNCQECLRSRNRKRTKKDYWTDYGNDVYKEKKREYSREWYEQNKLQKNDSNAKRKKVLKRASVATEKGKVEIKKIQLRTQLFTLTTGIPHELDHIIPLMHPLVSGLHVPANLQILTREQNKAKGTRFVPEEHEWKRPPKGPRGKR